MSYPIRHRESRGGWTPNQNSPYASPGVSNLSQNGHGRTAAYPSASRPVNTPTRGPGRPPLNRNRDMPTPQHTAPPQPQTYYRNQTFPPGPLRFFQPPPGQATRDPTLPPPLAQAIYSTYPSRLRTGVTLLVQPENVTGGPREREYLLAELNRELAVARSGSGTSTPRVDSPAPYLSASRRKTLSGRLTGRGGRVNYADKGSDEEDDEDDEEDESDVLEAPSDPDDNDYGNKRRRSDRDPSSGATPSARPWAGAGSIEHQAAVRAGKLRKKRDEMDRGWTWLGVRPPGERVRSHPIKATKHHYVSEELLEREASRSELLVPITIEFEVPAAASEFQGTKIKDRFLWNVNEPFITPHQFAVIFCDDIGISSNQWANTVADLIQTQLEEAQGAVEIDIADPEVTPDEVVWDEEDAQQSANGVAASAPIFENQDGVVEEDEEAEPEVREENWKEADCRIIVNLDVQIYTHVLRDRIEWDLSSTLPPTEFAKEYCRDLGLTGEAIPVIAHAITDELLKHKRDALELELFSRTHPEQQAKWEKTPGGGPRVTSRQGAKGLVAVWRDWWEREEFSPVLMELSMEEMERREADRTREARRMMRTLNTSKRRR